jgi:arginyl-tRNA synthetase
VAKTILYYQKHPLDLNYDKTLNKGYILGQMYVLATKELEKNPEYKTEVGEMMKKIESRKGKEYKLWQKTRKWTINQFAKIYKELGIKFNHIFYESEFINKGLEIAEDLKSQGVLKESQGAMIIDLEKYNLGVLLFFRTDGTALYPVADLPLAMEKFEKYKLDKSVNVVDIRQGLYFKQLFKVLEILGYKKEMVHLGYDVVKLPSGMMSSRLGNVITYEDLKREATKRTTQEIKTRHKKWSEAKIKKTATVIVNGALKFEMIKVDALQIITFDIDKALKFEGFTAAYLQYTYARINSIVRKSIKSIKSKVHKVESQKIDFSNLSEPKENNLIIKLAKYPEIVKKAGENYDPSEIAKYLFELAQEFNDYYHAVPVLKAEEKIRDARVVLIKAVAQVIRAGLGLLGIQTANEM